MEYSVSKPDESSAKYSLYKGIYFFSLQILLAFMGCLSRDKCLDMGKEIFYPKIIYLAFKANGNPVSDAKLLPTLKSVDFH